MLASRIIDHLPQAGQVATTESDDDFTSFTEVYQLCGEHSIGRSDRHPVRGWRIRDADLGMSKLKQAIWDKEKLVIEDVICSNVYLIAIVMADAAQEGKVFIMRF